MSRYTTNVVTPEGRRERRHVTSPFRSKVWLEIAPFPRHGRHESNFDRMKLPELPNDENEGDRSLRL